MTRLLVLGLFALMAFAQKPPVAKATHLAADETLNTDPASPLWKNAPAITADHGPQREPAPNHSTEIRLRWSNRNLYVLFTCPYEALHSRPERNTRYETNELWLHDVAEVFIGADFKNFWQYREYQVSPHGEWVDLDIDVRAAKPQGGWGWNSGFQVQARIDGERKVWYGAMKIPFDSINGNEGRAPAPGMEFRANFYRLQGPPPDRMHVAWSPTGAKNYHVPEKFGLLRLER